MLQLATRDEGNMKHVDMKGVDEGAKTGLSKVFLFFLEGGGFVGLTSVQIHEDCPQPKSSRVRKLTEEDEDENENGRHVAAVHT